MIQCLILGVISFGKGVSQMKWESKKRGRPTFQWFFLNFDFRKSGRVAIFYLIVIISRVAAMLVSLVPMTPRKMNLCL